MQLIYIGVVGVASFGDIHKGHSEVQASSISSELRLSKTKKPAVVEPPKTAPVLQAVAQRRERIARLLVMLDHVASATLQLKPETASRVEPVVVDLAEQTIDLSSDGVIREDSTDARLMKLETTVSALVKVMRKYVEPEMEL